MTLTRSGPVGVWDTTLGDQFWVLGAANTLDSGLLNAANSSVNIPLAAGGSLKLFAADFVNGSFPSGLFTPGSVFTLNVNFSDGSSASGNVTIGGGGGQTSVLTIATTNPASGVSIGVSPNDVSNQGAGSSQFTRTFNNGTSVTLTAPTSAGGNTFSSWTGCDATSVNICVVNVNSNRTVTANYTTGGGGGNPTITLSFDGMLRDKVGPCETCVNPDGQLDGTFTMTLGAASGNRTLTGLTLTRSGPVGVWDTTLGDQFWVLGAANTLDTGLLNAGNGSVNIALTAGGSLRLFAADFVNGSFPSGLFTPGSVFTLNANFSDGSSASGTWTIG
jgi:hypothetical protein